MGLHPPKGVQGKLVPAGTHGAICYAVYDLGTHYQEGKFAGDRHEIVVIFELPYQRITIDGVDKPMAISKRYTLTMGTKGNLRKDLESWRGKPFTDEELGEFDLYKMLGKRALIQIMHKKKADGNMAGVLNTIMALPKDMKIPLKPENKLSSFSFEEEFKGLSTDIPKWVASIIMESDEYKEMQVEQPPPPEDPVIDEAISKLEDDLPF